MKPAYEKLWQTRWRDLSKTDKLRVAARAAFHTGNALTYSLNLSDTRIAKMKEGQACHAFNKALGKHILKHPRLKGIPHGFALEFTEAKPDNPPRLHVHGFVILPVDDEATVETVRQWLRAAGGEMTKGYVRQLDTQPMYVKYVYHGKRQSPRNRKPDLIRWDRYMTKTEKDTQIMLQDDRIAFVSHSLTDYAKRFHKRAWTFQHTKPATLESLKMKPEQPPVVEKAKPQRDPDMDFSGIFDGIKLPEPKRSPAEQAAINEAMRLLDELN